MPHTAHAHGYAGLIARFVLKVRATNATPVERIIVLGVTDTDRQIADQRMLQSKTRNCVGTTLFIRVIADTDEHRIALFIECRDRAGKLELTCDGVEHIVAKA